MNCPTNELLHELILDEVEPAARGEIIEHVKACDKCSTRLRELLTAYGVLMAASTEEACPSRQEMSDYASGLVDTQTRARIASHLARCGTCRFLTSLLAAPEEERERLSRREFHLFQMAQIEERAADLTKIAIEGLLPEYPSLFEQVWPHAETFFERVEAGEDIHCDWPSLAEREQLVGALGFAADLPPSTRAAAVIAMTALAVMAEVAVGKVERDPDVLQRRLMDLGKRFGGGKELSSRLSRLLAHHLM